MYWRKPCSCMDKSSSCPRRRHSTGGHFGSCVLRNVNLDRKPLLPTYLGRHVQYLIFQLWWPGGEKGADLIYSWQGRLYSTVELLLLCSSCVGDIFRPAVPVRQGGAT